MLPAGERRDSADVRRSGNALGGCLIRRLASVSARALRKAARFIETAASTQTLAIRDVMSQHDMVAHSDESYYAEQYQRFLMAELEARFPDREPRVLDIGCGQGRLSFPIAAWSLGASVVGIDLTTEVIEAARRYAVDRGLRNTEFIATDAVDFLSGTAPASFDVILATEITFFMPRYRRMLSLAAAALAPGGFLFASFRSLYFNLLYSVRSRDWSSARLVRDQREGNWGGGSTWFSWHTAEDVRKMIEESGLRLDLLAGIGIASGIEGDPLAAMAQPSKLNENDRRQLLELELSLASMYSDAGRYILAIASKAKPSRRSSNS